jgi:hypothetical protein
MPDPIYGPELVTNGSCNQADGVWVFTPVYGIFFEYSQGGLYHNGTEDDYTTVGQSLAISQGKTYLLEFNVKTRSLHFSSTTVVLGGTETAITSTGLYSLEITTLTSDTNILFTARNGLGQHILIDDVSVKEIIEEIPEVESDGIFDYE